MNCEICQITNCAESCQDKEKSEPLPVNSNSLLDCPFCGYAFNPSYIKKHYMGEVFETYTCPGCRMQSPKLRCGGFLKDWWNQRASNASSESEQN